MEDANVKPFASGQSPSVQVPKLEAVTPVVYKVIVKLRCEA